VGGDRLLADHQLGRDCPVGLAGRHQLQHLHGQQPGPCHGVLGLVQDPAHRAPGIIDPTLSEPQLRHTRLWLPSPSVGLPVRLFCLGELTPHAMKLGPHVIGGGVRRLLLPFLRWGRGDLAGAGDESDSV
jgi:hypothetical protein